MTQAQWHAFGRTPNLFPPPRELGTSHIPPQDVDSGPGPLWYTASDSRTVHFHDHRAPTDSSSGYEPRRRDSLRRREALLKGRENTRRRKKWENDRLMDNPWAQPPEPEDFAPQPTHPIRDVPYALASLWDGGMRARTMSKPRIETVDAGPYASTTLERVARELRATLRRARSAKGLLMDLEGEIRDFLTSVSLKQTVGNQSKENAGTPPHISRRGSFEYIDNDLDSGSIGHDGLYTENLTSDEEGEDIVFVGRISDKGKRIPEDQSMPRSFATASKHQEAEADSDASCLHQKMMIESPTSNDSAKFARYLLHNLAEYYNLVSWSVSRGNPELRAAYIGVKADERTLMLPQPLWCRV